VARQMVSQSLRVNPRLRTSNEKCIAFEQKPRRPLVFHRVRLLHNCVFNKIEDGSAQMPSLIPVLAANFDKGCGSCLGRTEADRKDYKRELANRRPCRLLVSETNNGIKARKLNCVAEKRGVSSAREIDEERARLRARAQHGAHHSADCSQHAAWPCKTANGQYNSVDLSGAKLAGVLD
jgi:hypothetical protein